MTADTYRRRPLTVTARQVVGCDTGQAGRDLAAWCGGHIGGAYNQPVITVPCGEFGRDVRAHPGDWIVRHPDATFEVLTAAEFARYYTPVPDRTHWVQPHGQPITERGGAT